MSAKRLVKLSEEQIIGVLKEAEADAKTVSLRSRRMAERAPRATFQTRRLETIGPARMAFSAIRTESYAQCVGLQWGRQREPPN